MNIVEIHNKIDLGLQGIANNKKRTLEPFEKDYYFNTALLKYIDIKLNPRINTRQEGFDKTTKRLDDLRDLIKVVSLPCFYDDSITTYSILPSNYKHLTDCEVAINYDCARTTKYKFKDYNIRIAKVSILNSLVSGEEYYKNYTISMTTTTGTTVIYNSATYTDLDLYSVDSKFILINSIVSSINVEGLEIYWENYLDYNSEKIIFVSTNPNVLSITTTYISGTVTINTNTYNFSTITKQVYDENVTKKVSSELISTQDKSNITITNYYQNKNRHLKPIINIIDNKVFITNDNTFLPMIIKMYYISVPIFINSFINQTTNLQSNIQEVIDLCVELIYLDITNSVESQLRKNLKIE